MANVNEYLKKDIKCMIKNDYHNLGYIRGYIAACYNTGQIDKKNMEDLKEYLAEKIKGVK